MSDKFTPDDVRSWLVAAAAHDNGAGLCPWVMHGNTTGEQARAIIGARLRRRRPGVDAAAVVPAIRAQ
jgi:hypothetical protein